MSVLGFGIAPYPNSGKLRSNSLEFGGIRAEFGRNRRNPIEGGRDVPKYGTSSTQVGQSGPKSAHHFGPSSTDARPDSTLFDKVLANSTNVCPNSTARFGPKCNHPKFGQHRQNLAKALPNLAGVGQVWNNIGQSWPNSGRGSTPGATFRNQIN